MSKWDDQPIPEDDAIAAAHPVVTKRFDIENEARRLVEAKHSKGALIDLVNWLLHRIENEREECAKLCESDESEMGEWYAKKIRESRGIK